MILYLTLNLIMINLTTNSNIKKALFICKNICAKISIENQILSHQQMI